MEPISRAIEAADFVLIPTRVGLFDVGGIRPVIGFCRELKRPYMFVLTGTNPDAPGWPKLIRDASASLKKFGPVASKTIRERAAYISAINSGKAASEVGGNEGKAAAAEVNALWLQLKKQAGTR